MADTTKKIIRGVVNSRGFTITSPITQWDYGWQFIPEIEDLPPTYRLDFSNEEKHGTALPVYCSTDGAEVPTELIDTGKDVWVWFVRIGDGFGITEYKWRVPNKCKPKTEQDEPTPTQQSSIDQLIVRSNEAVESAEQSASDASTSAQNASANAERAEEARTDAQNYATQTEQARDDTQTYANNASASATASAQSASQSAQIKADVEDLADDAQASASASAQSATASANSASQAQGYAQSASASAQSASDYASQAQLSAQTASAKASEASTSVQTASTKASESAQSASQALTYKTDAESAKTASQTAQGLAESARDSAISAKNDAEQAKADAESARDEAQQAVASISGALAEKAPVITDTASGSIASFSDGADGLPLKSLVVNIDPVQDTSSGDPSPENLCPISGWTEINTYNDPLHGGSIEWNQYVENADFADGINKWTIVGTSTPSDYISVDNGAATVNMLGTQNNTQIANKCGSIKAVIGHKYYYKIFIKSSAWASSGNKVIAHIGGYWAKAISTALPVNEWVEISFIFGEISVSQNLDAGLRKYADENYSPFQIKDFVLCDLTKMFGAGNEPSTVEEFKALFPADYYPYNEGEKTTVSAVNGKPYTHVNIQLGQTVYGGKLDVLSGVLTVDRAMVDLGDLSWSTGFGGFHSLGIKSNAKVPVSLGTPTAICSMFPWSTSANECFYIHNATNYAGWLIVRTTSYSDAASFKTAMSGVQLVYELAEPITIQLTPNQVNSLLGVNNIWADSGDAEVEYRANTKLYIAKKIAEAISALS